MSTIETKKTLWPIEKLSLWKRNPRIMEDEGKERLKSQLFKLGQYKPLLIVVEKDGSGTVLGGNMRLTCMRELHDKNPDGEWGMVWVSIIDAPDDKTKLEYALSDNDSVGRYDEVALVDMVAEIPDFDMGGYHVDSGYSMDLEELADKYRQTDEDDFDAEKEAEKIETPISEIGTIWQLGEHRLMCGSATDIKHVNKLMGGVRADMSFTDPPYNVNYSGIGKDTSNKILNDNMGKSDFRDFLTDAFASYRVALKDDAALYVCYAAMRHREFEDAINASGYKVKAQIIWVKTVASMGWGDYRWKHEPILYCSLEGKKVPFYGDRKQYTEWVTKPTDVELLQVARKMLEEESKDGTTVWKLSREGGYVHPTQKPLELIEIALKNSTDKGNLVIDLFGGSGSTLMACQQMERKCYTMELDPKYADVIVARWEKFTGQKATLCK